MLFFWIGGGCGVDRSLNMLVFHEVIVLHMKLLLRRKTLSSVGYSSEQEVTPPQKVIVVVLSCREVIVMRRTLLLRRKLSSCDGNLLSNGMDWNMQAGT